MKTYIFYKGRSWVKVEASTILEAKKKLKQRGKGDYIFAHIKSLIIDESNYLIK